MNCDDFCSRGELLAGAASNYYGHKDKGSSAAKGHNASHGKSAYKGYKGNKYGKKGKKYFKKHFAKKSKQKKGFHEGKDQKLH